MKRLCGGEPFLGFSADHSQLGFPTTEDARQNFCLWLHRTYGVFFSVIESSARARPIKDKPDDGKTMKTLEMHFNNFQLLKVGLPQRRPQQPQKVIPPRGGKCKKILRTWNNEKKF